MLESAFFSLPNQHDQIFLKLNQMIYWLTKIIHTLASVKKKKKDWSCPWREWGEALWCSERCPRAAVDSIVFVPLWLGWSMH